MRLTRLDLIRYGRFTDVSIELPQDQRDLHVVFGPNEAGKTTSLTAIEDLLFGIPERSPYNFQHSYDSMRVGAVLENGDDRLEFQRRKSRREMILGPDGDPLPGDEGLLAPFLGGADRAYFDRMFNLSHDRLAEGGKTIIEAKDDVGQMLFSAGTGLTYLRERLKQLEEEADELWAPRRSQQRLYHQAEARLEDAKIKAAQTLPVRQYLAGRAQGGKRYQECVRAATARSRGNVYRTEEAGPHSPRSCGRTAQGRARTRNRRIGRVRPAGRGCRHATCRSREQEAEIKAQIEVLAPDLERVRQGLEGLAFDDALVRRAYDITQIHEQRIEVRRGRNDLPKRRDEYINEIKELAKLAVEIGWDVANPAELTDRVPQRSKLEQVRASASAGQGTGDSGSVQAQTALEEAEAALKEKKELLKSDGTSVRRVRTGGCIECRSRQRRRSGPDSRSAGSVR